MSNYGFAFNGGVSNGHYVHPYGQTFQVPAQVPASEGEPDYMDWEYDNGHIPMRWIPTYEEETYVYEEKMEWERTSSGVTEWMEPSAFEDFEYDGDYIIL